MNKFFYIYIASWSSACIFSLILFIKDKNSYAFYCADYWRFLSAPWKLITFAVSGVGITLLAPYSGDPTWDYFDAIFMSVLTFLSAPWVVGALYKTVIKSLPIKQTFVAFCVWMFSASWSYDLYLLIRDGYYPVTWFANIFASSLLYITAGLLWNLDYIKERGVIFSFMENTWPTPSNQSDFTKILWFALAFIVLGAGMILSTIWLAN